MTMAMNADPHDGVDSHGWVSEKMLIDKAYICEIQNHKIAHAAILPVEKTLHLPFEHSWFIVLVNLAV